jgi:hypothetical protein
MKKLIHEVPEVTGNHYQLYAEAVQHEGYTQLTFSSRWDGAKDPAGEQVKFSTFLPNNAIAALKEVLNGD